MRTAWILAASLVGNSSIARAAGDLPEAPTFPPPGGVKPGLPKAPLPKAPLPKAPLCNEGAPLHVAPGGTGDGSANAPLPSLAAALARARERNDCVAEARLAAGNYKGTSTLTLDRATRILGPATGTATLRTSLVSRGPWAVTVRKVSFSGTPGAAISVEHERAKTELVAVMVRRARGVGIRQLGGTLRVTLLGIEDTAVIAAERGTGVGLVLDEGVRADLDAVALLRNAGQALFAAGTDTRVVIKHSSVKETGHHPQVAAQIGADGRTLDERGLGAVQVARGALLLAERLDVFDSDFAGIAIMSSARAHLVKPRVRRVSSIPHASFDSVGGIAVAAIDGGTVEVRGFIVDGADVCGLGIQRGLMTAVDGSITRVAIGACFHPEDGHQGYGPACLQKNVKYVDVGVPLQAQSYALPNELDVYGGTRPEPWCPSVPWSEGAP